MVRLENKIKKVIMICYGEFHNLDLSLFLLLCDLEQDVDFINLTQVIPLSLCNYTAVYADARKDRSKDMRNVFFIDNVIHDIQNRILYPCLFCLSHGLAQKIKSV